MLLRARIGTQRLSGFDDDLIRLCLKNLERLGNELIQRHGLLRVLAVQQLSAYLRWRNFKNANSAVAQQKTLRQRVGVESCLGCTVNSRQGQRHDMLGALLSHS